ncbi:MAG: ferrous iron transporter B [Deltaproteobacteria bacterium]|nr:ferrous iron transporter B [Deltaproteobacteria bacterium]
MKTLLMGNPNVGKSVIFSRLTGINVISSNYPGTTVGFTQGFMKIGGESAQVIDVPGTYTLEPACEAEEIASKFLEMGDVVINVVDATNLERNLYLTLELLEQDIPVVVALNLWDETRHRGIEIDLDRLRTLLEAPVIPTSGLTGQGIKDLVESITSARSSRRVQKSREERWGEVGRIVKEVQRLSHRHHRWFERLEDASVKPVGGFIMALAILASSFYVIRLIGESLIKFILDPLFQNIWKPYLMKLSGLLGSEGFFHGIFIGKLFEGTISFTQSFGLLSSGLYVPLAMVLPYIISFYFILGIIEDTGYLPRLAVLLDTTMHKLGLHGYAIIPTMLGFGCNVPAILATRVLESRRERFIASTLIAIAVPCTSSQAMIFGLLGKEGGRYIALVYLTLLIVWILLGFVLNRLMKGLSPELLIEIPPYRMPPIRLLVQKLWLRIRGFIIEAVPIILAAVMVINILFNFGIFGIIADVTSPLITGVLGLPKEAVVALILGFFRKDAALGMLALLTLTPKQLVVGSVFLTMSFPCIATFAVLFSELGVKNLIKSVALMITLAFSVGGLLNLIL